MPQDGDIFDGKSVPGGTNIGACVWSAQRVKSASGKDADTYRPERGLEASGEQLLRMEKTSDLVFAYGRYQRLGKKVAMILRLECSYLPRTNGNYVDCRQARSFR